MTDFKRIYVFNRFERFWHWSQAGLIMFMALTGFEVHGIHTLFGFEQASSLHTTAAWVLIGLWAFAILWHLATGEYHPFKPTQLSTRNPVQRAAYLLFKLIMAPAILVSGLLYLYYSAWPDWGLGALDLSVVALIHTAAAFLLVIFLVGHVYLTTTGQTVFSQIRAMITGWDEVEVRK